LPVAVGFNPATTAPAPARYIEGAAHVARTEAGGYAAMRQRGRDGVAEDSVGVAA